MYGGQSSRIRQSGHASWTTDDGCSCTILRGLGSWKDWLRFPPWTRCWTHCLAEISGAVSAGCERGWASGSSGNRRHHSNAPSVIYVPLLRACLQPEASSRPALHPIDAVPSVQRTSDAENRDRWYRSNPSPKAFDAAGSQRRACIPNVLLTPNPRPSLPSLSIHRHHYQVTEIESEPESALLCTANSYLAQVSKEEKSVATGDGVTKNTPSVSLGPEKVVLRRVIYRNDRVLPLARGRRLPARRERAVRAAQASRTTVHAIQAQPVDSAVRAGRRVRRRGHLGRLLADEHPARRAGELEDRAARGGKVVLAGPRDDGAGQRVGPEGEEHARQQVEQVLARQRRQEGQELARVVEGGDGADRRRRVGGRTGAGVVLRAAAEG